MSKMAFKQIPLLSSFQLPRCYKPTSFEVNVEAQLHHFFDASEEACGSAT